MYAREIKFFNAFNLIHKSSVTEITQTKTGKGRLPVNGKLPVYKINNLNYLTCFESLVECTKRLNCPNDKLNELTHKLHFIVYKYFYNFEPHKVYSIIFTRDDITLLKTVGIQKNDIVSRSDKGCGVVLVNPLLPGRVNKDTCINSMTMIVSDRAKFDQISVF